MHRNDTGDVDGRQLQFLSFFFSLACSFCALLAMDEDVWSFIRLFLIKEDMSSLRLVIMGMATGGGAGRRVHSSGSSAAGGRFRWRCGGGTRRGTRGAFVRQCCGAAARCVPQRSWVADGREGEKTIGAAVVAQLFKTKLCSRDSAGRRELRYMPDLTKRVRCPDFRGRRCHKGNAYLAVQVLQN